MNKILYAAKGNLKLVGWRLRRSASARQSILYFARRKGRHFFYLDSTARTGNAVIKSATELFEELLRLEAHHYVSNELAPGWGNSGAVKKENFFKTSSKTLLLQYLRLYDAIEIFQVSHREVMKFYSSHYADFDNHLLFRIAVKKKSQRT